MRSKWTRRSSCSGAAFDEGSSFCSLSLLRIKKSIGLRGQSEAESGIAGRIGSLYAQCLMGASSGLLTAEIADGMQ